MIDQRATRAEQLFGEALEREGGARAAFLDEACAGDPALRAEVDAMLAAYERSAGYFDKLPERLGAAVFLGGASAVDAGAERAPAGAAGDICGPYVLRECVGSGGMGTVWLAERSDGLYESRVAIKLLSQFSNRAALERFTLEGRFLGKLTHPNIARLLDAGIATNGRPYLVIEYVRGLPIDQYCDEHRLAIPQRIGLFLQVLDAVAHAHAHLIVHRDIKPSNVQVTPEGVVKLLDFGVAKLLAGDSGDEDLTRQLGVALTPHFAAPEQLEGAPVTTSTDVYSLGLVLWLLVAGATPRTGQRPGSLAELRALASRDPGRLLDTVTSAASFDRLAALAARRSASAPDLLRMLRGDLDSIVRKAVAADPVERYATVADFAQDLRRFLDHQPVTAQANTAAYRFRKFLRRHRGGVATAALVILAIATAGGVAVWQGMEAKRQRDVAQYQQRRTQAANEFLNLLISEVGPGGKPVTMAELLDRGVGMLDRQYGAEEGFLAPILYELASAYFGLSRNDQAVALLERAEQAARQTGDADLLGASLCTLGRTQLRAEPEKSRERIRAGVAALGDSAEPSVEALVSCARGEALIDELDGNRLASIERLERTLVEVQAHSAVTLRQRLFVMNELARMHFNQRNMARTLELSARIRSAMERNGLEQTAGYLVNTANHATLLLATGEVLAALAVHEDIMRHFQGTASRVRPIGIPLAQAASLMRLERFNDARTLLEAELRAARDAGSDYVETEAGVHLARVDLYEGRLDDALRGIDAAERELRKAEGSNQRLLDSVAMLRAQVVQAQGDSPRAKAIMEQTLRGLGYPERREHPTLLNPLRVAARVELVAGDAATAERYASEFHTIAMSYARSPEHSADVGEALLLRAKARLQRNDATGARADLEGAIPGLTNGLGADHPMTREARALLASGT